MTTEERTREGRTADAAARYRQEHDLPPPKEWTRADVEGYRRILTHLGRLRRACWDVNRQHADCPGCELCWDADGLLWSVEMAHGCFESNAPPAAYEPARRGAAAPDHPLTWPDDGPDEGRADPPLTVDAGA
jgi:hypothetical protein